MRVSPRKTSPSSRRKARQYVIRRTPEVVSRRQVTLTRRLAGGARPSGAAPSVLLVFIVWSSCGQRRTGRTVDADALAAYRLAWDLADVASYVDQFRSPHQDDADTEHAWSFLTARSWD